MKKAYPNIHQKLIEDCRHGKRKAQFELYKQYSRAMYNVTLRMVGNAAEAEDLLQEAFLKVFQKIETYKGEVSFGAWVKRIVVNTTLDHLKRNRLSFDEIDESKQHVEDEELELPDGSSAAVIEQIKQAMAQLPDGYRVILSLVLFEGYDHEEVGQILGITASTSRSQFTRAKRKLLNLINL